MKTRTLKAPYKGSKAHIIKPSNKTFCGVRPKKTWLETEDDPDCYACDEAYGRMTGTSTPADEDSFAVFYGAGGDA